MGEVTTSDGINITLQWIPGYKNNQANKIADTLANQDAKCMQQNHTTSMTTTKQTIKQHKTEDWM